MQKCLNLEDSKAYSHFPYHVLEGCVADVEKKYVYLPRSECHEMPKGIGDSSPTYLVNIPLAYRGLEKMSSLLAVFKEEAFGIDLKESSAQVSQRIAIVIGVNHPHSLDNSVNQEFYDSMRDLPRVEGIAYRVFGFSWIPKWSPNTQRLYSKEKAYVLLKAFCQKAALSVLDNQERLKLESQIPFQGIREFIKESKESRLFASFFEREAPQSPIYLGVMDADCYALRSQQMGLFSSLDKIIGEERLPSTVSCGYQVQDDERPIIRLGVKLDMYVREAMNRIIPYACYFPEPASFFCIRRPGDDRKLSRLILSELTFIGGNKQTLENRRLIENARLKHLFDDRAIFLRSGGVVTGTPERMKTQKNGKVEQLSVAVVKQKQTLQSLRGIAQTHATPKEWADNLYVGLKFSYKRVTDVTGPMMHIFGVFDPISRMYALGDSKGRYTGKYFDEVMRSYYDPLSEIQKKILLEEKSKLLEIGMTEEKINLVVSAAQASGEAIYQVFLEETGVESRTPPPTKGAHQEPKDLRPKIKAKPKLKNEKPSVEADLANVISTLIKGAHQEQEDLGKSQPSASRKLSYDQP